MTDSGDRCGGMTRDACACAWAMKADGWCIWCGDGCCTADLYGLQDAPGMVHSID